MLESKKIWLTNFCESLHVFVFIVMIQIVVIIYALSFLSFDFDFLNKLSILSMFAQFVGLNLIIMLCKLRFFFNRQNVIMGVLILIVIVILMTTLLTQLFGYFYNQLAFNLFIDQTAINHLNFKLSLSAVIICLALIRYFYIQDQWNSQLLKLSEAKLQALQARIKPHFLFNSLNSIASLISIDADRAELAISDFSNLMRRTFTHKDQFISINEELEWVHQYLSIEKLRLDKRLQYQIQCDESIINHMIPVLCIQPLIENAILHGIQPLEHGGTIDLKIYPEEKNLIVQVENPYLSDKHKKINGIALANIKERLQLHYGDNAYMKHNSDNFIYHIKLSIPL
jgi:two-component system sensor histidine kinase AlgZ